MKPDSRSRTALYYGIPMLFCLAVHLLALRTWFYLDDFAWLGLRLELTRPHDLLHILFHPESQGTIRTLSERVFFLVFYSIFGLHAPPFHIWTFLTQFVNIFLLIRITTRLTGLTLAGFLAPILWTGNAGLAIAMGWSSAYNEIAFVFFILLAFYLFLRYIDTGQAKYWIWQWVVFILGFGALELNVVYPALAAGYALFCTRKYFAKTLWLFIPSVAYTIVHFTVVPPPADPYYQMHFGFSPLKTLWAYWLSMVGAVRTSKVDWRPLWLGYAVVATVTAALAIFVWKKLRQRELLPIFLLGWFLAIILPVLPLENHFTEYYVTGPSIGIAMLAAWAIADSRGIARVAAMGLAAIYLVVSIADTHVAERYYYDQARRVKYLVTGVEALAKQQSGRKILLAGIDNNLFWNAIFSDPFRLFGFREIYLVPGSERELASHPEWGGIARFTINPGEAVMALKSDQAMVVQLEGRHLRDVSNAYLAELEKQLDGRAFDFVDVTNPKYADRIGDGWYPPEAGYRWMGKTAIVKLDRPKKAGQVLKIHGFCPEAVLAQGPLEATFRAGGVDLGSTTLKGKGQNFDVQFPLPESLIGSSIMDVEIEVNRTIQPGSETRKLGLVFGTFSLE